MKRIVVGMDDSAGAFNALRWATRLAGVAGAEIVVLRGFEPTESELPPGRVEALLAAERSAAEECLDIPGSSSVPARAAVERGDPRPAILDVANREDADLVVVGRKGESAGPGLLHIGSTAEWLAHHTDRPLAVVGGAVNLEIRSALVGLDGSPGSGAAVAWTANVAARGDMRVIAVTVDQPRLMLGTDTKSGSRAGQIEDLMSSDWGEPLIRCGVEFDTVVRQGVNAADELLTAAQDERADIIVVGLRGLGGFTGLRIGGVALKVLHRADRPVVLVPPT